jgi:glycosyltransferase involved in cell wall biosynthesis
MSERLRIALWTPLPPIQNGIADYSVELLSCLSHNYDIEVFIDNGYEPARWLSDNYRISRYPEFEKRHHDNPFTVIIYQLGGSSSHHYMYEAIQKWAGLVVLHDLFMGMSLYKYFGRQSSPNRRFASYLRQESKQIEHEFKTLFRLHGAAHDTAVDDFFSSHYFLNWVVASSLGQIVHMKYAEEELKRQYPGAHPYVVNMGVQTSGNPEPGEALRQRFGIDPSTFVIGIFGKINKHKGHHICLEAVHRLVKEHPNILLVIVGPYIQSDYFDELRTMVMDYGLQRHVHFAGYLDRTHFDQVLLACDAVVNLRYPAQMQMSATLIRALAAAKPVIISDIPEWELFPDTICLRLRHGDNDVNALEIHLKRLIDDPLLGKTIGMNAKRFVDENATLPVMARQYEDIISKIAPNTSTPLSSEHFDPNDLKTLPSDIGSRLPQQRESPGLPIEQVSLDELHQLLKEWHQLQKVGTASSVVRRRPKFVEFLVHVARRVRYLGLAWQVQGSLYEAMTQRHEMLSREVNDMTEQVNILRAEVEHLRNSLGN